jgi:hypothetical protein
MGALEISPAGRTAAFVTAACLAVAGLAYVFFSWDELTCDPSYLPCFLHGGKGALIAVLGFIGVVVGTIIALLVRRRPVVEGGYSGWTVSLSMLFILGTLLVVKQLPLLTCPAGTHLDALAGLCINDVTRFDATNWLWLKWVLAGAGIVVGATVIHRRRWMLLTVPAAVAAWFLGFGWLLLDTVARRVSN